MFTISPQSNTPITIDSYKIKSPFQKHSPAKNEELDEYINELEDDFEDDESEYPLDYISQLDYSNQSSNPHSKKAPDNDFNNEEELEDDDEDYVVIEDEDDDNEIVTGMGY